jgi:thioredoxin reductase (NADPH)
VDFSGRPFRCVGDSGEVYEADSVIIATGAQARWLGLPSEKRLQGAGVSACATCDGFFFRGKRVAVVGGGNTAVEEALYLTHHAAHVTLIHRRATLRAEKILQQRLFAHPKIEVIWDHAIDEVVGDSDPMGVTGVRLKSTVDGSTRQIDCDGVFIAIGHAPASELFKGQLEMDAAGYLKVRPGSAGGGLQSSACSLSARAPLLLSLTPPPGWRDDWHFPRRRQQQTNRTGLQILSRHEGIYQAMLRMAFVRE